MITDIEGYLESHNRDYLTEEFGFSSYNPPNTMYQVSNSLDELLLQCSYHAIKMWHRSVSLLKRNKDAVRACTIEVTFKLYDDVLSRNYYYKALKELTDHKLLIPTPDKNIYVINVQMANKLYKPQLEL